MNKPGDATTLGGMFRQMLKQGADMNCLEGRAADGGESIVALVARGAAAEFVMKAVAMYQKRCQRTIEIDL